MLAAEQVLVSAWLTELRSARTRRAYAGDVAACLGWLAGRDTGALAAGRVHDLWAATQLGEGAAASSVRRLARDIRARRDDRRRPWHAGARIGNSPAKYATRRPTQAVAYHPPETSALSAFAQTTGNAVGIHAGHRVP